MKLRLIQWEFRKTFVHFL